VVDDVSRETMARATAVATQRASIRLAALAKGDLGEASIGQNGSWTALPVRRGSATPASPVKFGDLFTVWAAERQAAPKTLYEWTRVVRHLTTFLGHDDARRVTAEDLIRWKDSMVVTCPISSGHAYRSRSLSLCAAAPGCSFCKKPAA
jgi:hypothetical protein